ncbi:hypothetical protein L3X38_022412 [Prunus dulcis]|uniref:Uncharacterized protein n=1 Tax=Prunus dulcis TaxID=3755 RepID=A0AAD4VW18_PRUDU|nr:hypothetical protein L3X38_022412 [Prunus dulcis]
MIGVVLELKNSAKQAITPQCSPLEFDSSETTGRGPLATDCFEADSNFQGATTRLFPATSRFSGRASSSRSLAFCDRSFSVCDNSEGKSLEI